LGAFMALLQSYSLTVIENQLRSVSALDRIERILQRETSDHSRVGVSFNEKKISQRIDRLVLIKFDSSNLFAPCPTPLKAKAKEVGNTDQRTHAPVLGLLSL
jgi:hypothetical protein